MKNIRIIPRLDIKGPNVVKPVLTEALRIVGTPRNLAQRYYNEGADEIVYMDVVASLYQRNLDCELLRTVTNDIFVPVTVGGGIRTIHDINSALRSGADKVAINTYAVSHPNFLSQAAHEFGSQCIALSIEAKKQDGDWYEVYTDGGREHTGVNAVDWARKGIELGAGELLLTSIDRDGTRRGYDTELIQLVTDFAPIPVVVSGGAGDLGSISSAIKDGRADAVAAASIFHYEEHSIDSVKTYLRSCNVNVRL